MLGRKVHSAVERMFSNKFSNSELAFSVEFDHQEHVLTRATDCPVSLKRSELFSEKLYDLNQEPPEEISADIYDLEKENSLKEEHFTHPFHKKYTSLFTHEDVMESDIEVNVMMPTFFEDFENEIPCSPTRTLFGAKSHKRIKSKSKKQPSTCSIEVPDSMKRLPASYIVRWENQVFAMGKAFDLKKLRNVKEKYEKEKGSVILEGDFLRTLKQENTNIRKKTKKVALFDSSFAQFYSEH